MEEIKSLFIKDKLERTINSLKENGFEVEVVDTPVEAEKAAINLIPEGSSISMGGSVTLNMTGLLKKFRTDKYKFFERFNQPTWEATVKVMRESLLSDFLVTGTNAVTEDGFLMQIDSGGNRVAGMAYGPKNVIVITGVNKIVNHKTPCKFTGKCEDCTTGMRMCNLVSAVKSGNRPFGKTYIIFINDNLGY